MPEAEIKMKKRWSKYIGPGPLIAAAFIGPGTVTVCTLSGVSFGYDLLWALLLSIVATVVLQEMAGRIGLVTQKGLPEIIRETVYPKFTRFFALGWIILAIVIGNAAYEAGNLGGAAMGLDVFESTTALKHSLPSFNIFPLLIGIIAWLLLMIGSFKWLTRIMIVIVLLMSVVFMVTAVMTVPEWTAIFAGFRPQVDDQSIMTVVALIGTTVVPYNLFLHASGVSERWKSVTDLKYMRVDLIIAVVLGGLISMAILITGAASGATEVETAVDLAKSLEPLLGSWAGQFLGIGLLAAGITSAITAPLAAALVISGCFGWSKDLKSAKMRWVFSAILLIGVVFASLGIKPVQLIQLAQVSNGILLPVMATFILWTVNRKNVMGKFRNGWLLNVLGILIWLVTWVLGAKSVWAVVG